MVEYVHFPATYSHTTADERKFRTPDYLATFLKGQNPQLDPTNQTIVHGSRVYRPVLLRELARDLKREPIRYAGRESLPHDSERLIQMLEFLQGKSFVHSSDPSYRITNPRIHLPSLPTFSNIDLKNLICEVHSFVYGGMKIGNLTVPGNFEVLSPDERRYESTFHLPERRDVAGEHLDDDIGF